MESQSPSYTSHECIEVLTRCQLLAAAFGEARLLALLTGEQELAAEASHHQQRCMQSVQRMRAHLAEVEQW